MLLMLRISSQAVRVLRGGRLGPWRGPMSIHSKPDAIPSKDPSNQWLVSRTPASLRYVAASSIHALESNALSCHCLIRRSSGVIQSLTGDHTAHAPVRLISNDAPQACQVSLDFRASPLAMDRACVSDISTRGLWLHVHRRT